MCRNFQENKSDLRKKGKRKKKFADASVSGRSITENNPLLSWKWLMDSDTINMLADHIFNYCSVRYVFCSVKRKWVSQWTLAFTPKTNTHNWSFKLCYVMQEKTFFISLKLLKLAYHIYDFVLFSLETIVIMHYTLKLIWFAANSSHFYVNVTSVEIRTLFQKDRDKLNIAN